MLINRGLLYLTMEEYGSVLMDMIDAGKASHTQHVYVATWMFILRNFAHKFPAYVREYQCYRRLYSLCVVVPYEFINISSHWIMLSQVCVCVCVHTCLWSMLLHKHKARADLDCLLMLLEDCRKLKYSI